MDCGMTSRGKLLSYGLTRIGTLKIVDDEFSIHISDEKLVNAGQCIYAFLVDDEIVRIGSSKAPLRTRLRAWQRDVSKALKGRKSPTPQSECEGWKEVLANKAGEVFARRGSFVQTPVGEINAYLAEEAALINRHRPRFCRR